MGGSDTHWNVVAGLHGNFQMEPVHSRCSTQSCPLPCPFLVLLGTSFTHTHMTTHMWLSGSAVLFYITKPPLFQGPSKLQLPRKE